MNWESLLTPATLVGLTGLAGKFLTNLLNHKSSERIDNQTTLLTEKMDSQTERLTNHLDHVGNSIVSAINSKNQP